jgi:hypothetical protein
MRAGDGRDCEEDERKRLLADGVPDPALPGADDDRRQHEYDRKRGELDPGKGCESGEEHKRQLGTAGRLSERACCRIDRGEEQRIRKCF